MMDGCTRIGVLWRILLPLAAANISFNPAPGLSTLPAGIPLYQGEFAFPWPTISAALMVGIVLIVAIIVPVQPQVLAGLGAGGMKG